MDLLNRIYNINGQLIYEGKSNQINMSEFPSGIYFFKIGDLTKKIIKK
ncbi:T9SS type A sorting domain-containing protein [Empedobacter stercoris]